MSEARGKASAATKWTADGAPANTGRGIPSSQLMAPALARGAVPLGQKEDNHVPKDVLRSSSPPVPKPGAPHDPRRSSAPPNLFTPHQLPPGPRPPQVAGRGPMMPPGQAKLPPQMAAKAKPQPFQSSQGPSTPGSPLPAEMRIKLSGDIDLVPDGMGDLLRGPRIGGVDPLVNAASTTGDDVRRPSDYDPSTTPSMEAMAQKWTEMVTSGPPPPPPASSSSSSSATPPPRGIPPAGGLPSPSTANPPSLHPPGQGPRGPRPQAPSGPQGPSNAAPPTMPRPSTSPPVLDGSPAGLVGGGPRGPPPPGGPRGPPLMTGPPNQLGGKGTPPVPGPAVTGATRTPEAPERRTRGSMDWEQPSSSAAPRPFDPSAAPPSASTGGGRDENPRLSMGLKQGPPKEAPSLTSLAGSTSPMTSPTRVRPPLPDVQRIGSPTRTPTPTGSRQHSSPLRSALSPPKRSLSFDNLQSNSQPSSRSVSPAPTPATEDEFLPLSPQSRSPLRCPNQRNPHHECTGFCRRWDDPSKRPVVLNDEILLWPVKTNCMRPTSPETPLSPSSSVLREKKSVRFSGRDHVKLIPPNPSVPPEDRLIPVAPLPTAIAPPQLPVNEPPANLLQPTPTPSLPPAPLAHQQYPHHHHHHYHVRGPRGHMGVHPHHHHHHHHQHQHQHQHHHHPHYHHQHQHYPHHFHNHHHRPQQGYPPHHHSHLPFHAPLRPPPPGTEEASRGTQPSASGGPPQDLNSTLDGVRDSPHTFAREASWDRMRPWQADGSVTSAGDVTESRPPSGQVVVHEGGTNGGRHPPEYQPLDSPLAHSPSARRTSPEGADMDLPSGPRLSIGQGRPSMDFTPSPQPESLENRKDSALPWDRDIDGIDRPPAPDPRGGVRRRGLFLPQNVVAVPSEFPPRGAYKDPYSIQPPDLARRESLGAQVRSSSLPNGPPLPGQRHPSATPVQGPPRTQSWQEGLGAQMRSNSVPSAPMPNRQSYPFTAPKGPAAPWQEMSPGRPHYGPPGQSATVPWQQQPMGRPSPSSAMTDNHHPTTEGASHDVS